MKKVEMFGITIDTLSFSESVEYILSLINANEKIVHVGVNSNKIVLMAKNPALRKMIQDADMVNADGFSMVKACKWLLNINVERVAGIDTFYVLLEEAEKRGLSVFFLGAKEATLCKMLGVVREKYPNLQIAGAHHGYFQGDERKVIEEINKVKPHMVFLGITSPFKEEFVYQYKEDLSANLLMGVGGSFDVLSGDISRAPLWMQTHGLEWLHRFSKEPRRLFKRYVHENIYFLFLLMKEKKKIKNSERKVF